MYWYGWLKALTALHPRNFWVDFTENLSYKNQP
jgi:hypothetical protein